VARASSKVVASRIVAQMVGGSVAAEDGGVESLGCLTSPRNCPRIMRLAEGEVNMPLMMTFSLGTPAALAIASITGLLAMPERVSMSQVMFLRVKRTLMRLVYEQMKPGRQRQSRRFEVWLTDELVLGGQGLQSGGVP